MTDKRDDIEISWSPGGMSWYLIDATEVVPYAHQFQIHFGGVSGKVAFGDFSKMACH